MGNLMGKTVLIQLFDFTCCLSMRSIHQSRKDIRFQIVFQTAAVNGGVNQRGTARISQVDVEVVYPRVSPRVAREEAPILLDTPAMAAATTRFFTVRLLPSSFRVLPTSRFAVDERYGSLAGQRGECGIGCRCGRAVYPSAAPNPAPAVTTVTARTIHRSHRAYNNLSTYKIIPVVINDIVRT